MGVLHGFVVLELRVGDEININGKKFTIHRDGTYRVVQGDVAGVTQLTSRELEKESPLLRRCRAS